MARYFSFAYALVCYAVFLISFVALSAFLLNIDGMRGQSAGNWLLAALIDGAMIGSFAVAHSVMARPWFKRLWTRVIPPATERATYVLQSSLFILLIVSQWRPIPELIWEVGGTGAVFLYSVFAVGAGIVVLSTFLLGHFEFLGISQTWRPLRGKPQQAEIFRTPLLYRIVRHPLQFGLLLMFFAVPTMTVGHMLFAVSMTVYMLIGLHFEEIALVRTFGDAYRDYQRRVPRLIPWPSFSDVRS